ncbi:hypothetical protein ACI8AA_01495 [Geodermatophilus sp. SYSU D01180]
MGIERPRRWQRRRWARVLRWLCYTGAALLAFWLVRAIVVMVNGAPMDFPPGFNLEEICSDIAPSCGAVTGFALPWLTLAFVTALFFVNRLWFVPRERTRRAKESPHKLVPTAGSVTGEVVGRDELCKVLIDNVHANRDRRPQLIIGGVGTGKTAVMVQLTKLLAEYGATPVAIRLRDVEKTFSFREVARMDFKNQVNARLLSDAEGEKVWRFLRYDDRIVVLADGLEEALTQDKDRDDRIRLAVTQARRDNLPLVIASRPHESLRGMDASVLELEPLSEEAALQYLGSGSSQGDPRRIDWIVETAGVTEAPLYLRIAHELDRERLLGHLVTDDEEAATTVNTRDLDRSALRRNLLDTWRSALTRGRLHGESPLTPSHRQATVALVAALACVGLLKDKLEVKYVDALLDGGESEGTGGEPGQDSGEAEEDVRRRGLPALPVPTRQSDVAAPVDSDEEPDSTWELDEFRTEGLTAWVRKSQERLRRSSYASGVVNTRLAMTVNTRIAATWGAQLGLVEVRGEAVRFQHSVLQAYLGSLPLEDVLDDPGFLDEAFRWPDRPGREMLIAMVLLSRAEAGQQLNEGVTNLASATPGSDNATAVKLVETLHERIEMRFRSGYDNKCLDILAAALEIGTVAPADKRHQLQLVQLAAKNWSRFNAADPRTLEEAKLGFVYRLSEALREVDQRSRKARVKDDSPERKDIVSAYRELFKIGCFEAFSYPVRRAVAEELGAGGTIAFLALRGNFRKALQSLNTDEWMTTGERWRATVMSAWLAPLLLTPDRRDADTAGKSQGRDFTPRRNLEYWIRRVGRPEIRARGGGSEGDEKAGPGGGVRGGGRDEDVHPPNPGSQLVQTQVTHAPDATAAQGPDDQGRLGGAGPEDGDPWLGTYRQLPVPPLPISIEVALARGFRYAANRRERHRQAHADARTHLAEQALELLKRSGFWFSQLTLLQALGLWALPDDADGGGERIPGPSHKGVDGADIRARVHHWVDVAGSLRDEGREPRSQGDAPRTHRFVVEAGELVINALESGRPERFLWVDEHGVTSKIGASAMNRAELRKHQLWIPPSIGWSALDPRAQQLVADVLLLMNLADRGDDVGSREERLMRVNRRDLPPCITTDRAPLDPNRKIGSSEGSRPGKTCPGDCEYGLCPYPPKGNITYHAELTETFCRRQQTLLDHSLRRRAAPWQEIAREDLRQFWREMAARARR